MDWQASLDASFASRGPQYGPDQFNKFSGFVQRALGNFVAHRNGARVGLVSACLQVVKDTGDLTSKDFTLTDKSPSKFGSNGGLESSKVGTTDTGIKGTMRSVPFCSLQVALRFGEKELPHALCTSDRALNLE
jgi:hypothetical protein